MKYPIVTECYIDQLLVEIVCELKDSSTIKQHTKHKVLNWFNGRQNKAVGIIDEDKGKNRPDILKRGFVLFEEFNQLNIWKHNQNPFTLLEIKPAADGFIFNEAQKNGLLEKYNLPIDMKHFVRLSKDTELYKNVAIRNLIKEIKNSDNESIKMIKKIVQDILE